MVPRPRPGPAASGASAASAAGVPVGRRPRRLAPAGLLLAAAAGLGAVTAAPSAARAAGALPPAPAASTASAPGGVEARLAAAIELGAADPRRALVQLQALRAGLPGGNAGAAQLAAAEAECRLLSDLDGAEGLARANAALAGVAPPLPEPARRAWLMLRACHAGLLHDQGEVGAAQAALDRLLAEADARRDAVPHALALLERGVVRSRAGQFDVGQADLLAACGVLESQGIRRDAELCLYHLVNHYRRVGDVDEALRLLQPLAASAQRRRADYDASIYAYGLGQLAQQQGRWQDSLQHMAETAAASQRLGDANGEAAALTAMASALVRTGRAPEALRQVQRALATLQPREDPRQFETSQQVLAEVLLALGRHREALAAVDRVEAAVRRRDLAPAVADLLQARATALQGLGRWREAYLALDEARKVAQRVTDERLSRQSAALRMQFNRARDAQQLALLSEREAQGQRLRRMQAVALALGAVLLAGVLALALRKTRLAGRLQRLAATDELTGLPNRRALLAQADQALALARRTGQPVALLMIDVDHFKRVNDGRGHAVGDLVLRHVAATLANGLRAADRLGRIGGEEFVAVLPATPLDEACRAAERMRAAIAATPLVQPGDGGPALAVTVSIGVAASDGADSAASVLARADQGLYAAKAAGRNRVLAGMAALAADAAQAAGRRGEAGEGGEAGAAVDRAADAADAPDAPARLARAG